MKILKTAWSVFLTLLVVSLGFQQIDNWGDFGMQTAIKSWSGWARLAAYWYIPVGVVVLACFIYGSIKAYRWIKLWAIKQALAALKAAQAATANANQPPAGNPAPDPLAPPAPAAPPAGNPPQPAPTTPPTPPEDERNVVPFIHFLASLALNAILIVGLSFMVYLYIDQLDKNSELMKANYSLESKIIQKQKEIAQEFGVPLPSLTTEAEVKKADAKQVFLGGGCDFFNVQVPDRKQKYLALVKGTSAANACVIDGTTSAPTANDDDIAIEPTEPAAPATPAPATTAPAPSPPPPAATPAVPATKPAPAAPIASTPAPKPKASATGTGRRTFGSSYTPPTTNQQTGEWQGAQGTPSSSSGNFSAEGKVYTLGEPNPPTPATQPSDGGTVFHPF